MALHLCSKVSFIEARTKYFKICVLCFALLSTLLCRGYMTIRRRSRVMCGRIVFGRKLDYYSLFIHRGRDGSRRGGVSSVSLSL